MSGTHSIQLQDIDKKKLRELASQARADGAKRAQKTGDQFPSAAGVSFGEPIKVSASDHENDIIQKRLGNYEVAKRLILSSSGPKTDLLGVDRQPATPLPSKDANDGFFSKSSRNPNLPKRLIPDHVIASSFRKERDKFNPSAVSDKHQVKRDEKVRDDRYSNKISTLNHRHNVQESNSSSHKGHNPIQTKESSHGTEKPVSSHNQAVSSKSHPYRRSHGESHRQSHSPSHLTASQPDKSSAHSEVKESVTQSKPQPAERDSILSTFGKELAVNSSASHSKSADSSQSQSDKKDDLSKPNNASAKTRPLDSSILKVKEDNRNGMNTLNGRMRPTIHIPEKNVEDMLKELTHIPQPLTALYTPLKEGGKFPFQVPEKPDPVSRDSKTVFEAPKETDMSSREVARTSASLDLIEPIASPNEEESDDSGSGSDSEAEALEDGEIQSEDSDADVIAPAGHNSSFNSDNAQVPHAAPVPAVSTAKPTAAPVKEPRKSSSKMSSGSSDSSSSGSEDSNSSDSDSDDDHVASEDEEDNQHKNETTPPKSKTSPLEEEESPLSASKQQKWSLKSFLPERETSLLGPSSVKSVDNPWSNKSDANHYIDDVDHPIRPADQVISDDNPPSDKIPEDHDIFSKPLSDEFSPPSLPYKHPITSPKFNVSDIQHKSQTFDVSPHTPANVYDTVKARKRTPSLKSPEVPERISTPKAKRSRKSKPIVLSSECSSSEDEFDRHVSNSSQSADVKEIIKESPKPLPKSPRKSQSVSKTDSRSATPSKASKKKESKQEKQTVEKDSVRLKSEGKKPASKAADCDKSASDKSDLSLSSTKLDSDSIEKIFDTFHPECLLSPIPNVPEKSHVASVQKDILPVPKEKPVLYNGSVTYRNGKPSVMVQINLDLLSIHLNLDGSKSVDKDVSKAAILENKLRNSEDKSRPKLEPCSKPTVIENSKPEKKHKSESAKVTNLDKLSSKLTSASTNNSEICDKSKLLPSVRTSATESLSKSAGNSKAACATQKVLTSSPTPDYSSFESLPFRPSVEQPVKKLAAKKQPHASLSYSSSSSSSESGSDSDSESDSDNNDHSVEVNAVSPVPDQSTEVCVQDMDAKKRKPDSHRTEDSKRRKTASKSPHNSLCSEAIVKGDNYEEKQQDWNQKHIVSSKERRHSSSSQHSTQSTHSTWSNLSQQGQGHSRKKAKLEAGDESLSQSSTSRTSDPHSSSKKHPIKSDRPEPSEVIVNGHANQSSAPNSSNPITEGNRTMVSPFWIRDQEERLEDANEYHIRAKKAKHHADAMESGLQQNILYLEAALCFIQSGCAMERNHKVVQAASFFKETHRFVVHNPHFRMPHDPETADKAELKLAVLCLRVQSLLYLKMFMLKKTESLKLKRVLEDHNNKSVKSAVAGSQSKPPPSAPSPHQTWNRSTGTPSPMSPTPSPVGSVCSVGSVGSMNELTPSKSTNGTSVPLAPAGHVVVPTRIHSITQKYFTSTNYLVSCHDLWDQADSAVTIDIKDFFAQLDMDCGRLTMQSSLLHLVRYVKHGLQLLKLS